MRPNERVKPPVQNHTANSNDITARGRGDATIAVWQVHATQCESEHLLDFLTNATTAIMRRSPMPSKPSLA